MKLKIVSTVLIQELTLWSFKSYKLDVDFKEAKEDLRKKILYLEAYSRRENLKFEGIPEVKSDQEDTKNVLTNFISRQLGIENPEDIELYRIRLYSQRGNNSIKSKLV